MTLARLAAVEARLETERAGARLTKHGIAGFLALDFPPREFILDPLIPTQGAAMVYAYRGVGKTHVSIGCAVAAASGGSFLKFAAAKPRRVLFVDGEMPARALQERFAAAITRANATIPEGYLGIITPDAQEAPMPDLADPAGQRAIEAQLDGAELLILDNLSTLCRVGAENEAESWMPVQAWILALRRAGIAVLLVHHAGKGGAQRGTSKREDILDTVVALKRPDDYLASQGARFEIHFEKARGLVGAAAAGYEAWLQGDAWTLSDLEDQEAARIVEMKESGLTVRGIAKELGVSPSKVYRTLNPKLDADS